jgi:hypothetical protein
MHVMRMDIFLRGIACIFSNQHGYVPFFSSLHRAPCSRPHCVFRSVFSNQGKPEQLFRRPYGVGMCPLSAALLEQCIKSGKEISPPNPDVYIGEDNQFTTLHHQIADKYVGLPPLTV